MDSTKGDFKSVLIEDSRVAGIGPDIHFGVMSSGKSTYCLLYTSDAADE